MNTARSSCQRAPFLLALGDSLTAGYGLATHEGLTARLQALLRDEWPDARVHNAGVSGNTTSDALQRLPRVLASLTSRPDLALVALGANDLLRGTPPARTRANLDLIVEEIGRCGITVLLATFEPPPLLAGFAGNYLGIYEQIAAKHRVPTCGFFPPGVLGHPDMVLADRLHPNARAIERIARFLLPPIVAALRTSAERAA
ncbi:arylesterase [Sphingomonas nostoxanthinifaciens]|uniref:arylesterase n=1 Tax=Sphingomonas nostoxanthinifaciens TaxID=2872652 RepID=UPI001CC1D316|nr:arylesterase [Sphingomonas nostoxanthinifaciens]UAK25236.1 arylesterase [Sphingomonas nostoxanthinifaciens]